MDVTDLASSSKPIPVIPLSPMQIEYNNSEYNDCVDDKKDSIFPQVCSVKRKNKGSS